MGCSKPWIFAKRTAKYFCPLILTVWMLKGIYGDFDSSTLVFPLSSYGLALPPDSAKFLSIELASKRQNLPKDVKDFGTLLEVTKNNTVYSIDQANPYNDFIFDENFKYRKGVIDGKSDSTDSNNVDSEFKITIDDTNSGKKYTLSKSDFEKTKFKNKGDLNLVMELEVSLEDSLNIPIVTAVDFEKLFFQSDYEHQLLELKSSSSSISSYSIKFNKGAAANDLSFEIKNKNQISKTSSSSNDTLESGIIKDIEIKSFYVLFTDNPSLDFNKLFSTSSSESVVSGSSNNLLKRVHLKNWSKDSDYSVDNTWKSACWDPHRVGGFKDQEDSVATSSENTVKNSDTSNATSYIQKQLKTSRYFNPVLTEDEKKFKQPGQTPQFYPTKRYTTPAPCENLDEETKKKLKEFLDKDLEREVITRIDKKLMPESISRYIDNNNNNTLSSTGSIPTKIIQASFRAWGGVYNLSHQSGNQVNVKANDYHNPRTELALRTQHVYSLKIAKNKVISELIEHEKLKENLNKQKEISSMLQIAIPYSFSVYDPIANYLKREKVSLYMDLDLRSIYKKSHFHKDFYTYDLSIKHSKVGIDWGGANVGDKAEKRQKPYGISGAIVFSAGLEIDVEKNLKVNLIVTTKGFVSTKNATCDLRDRLYKYKTDENEKKCSSSSSWKFRDHIHIPPFLVVQIDKDPSISSFYIDRRTTTTTTTTTPSSSTEVETLEKLKTDLESRSIKKIHSFSRDSNAEVYFETISASEQSTWDEKSSSSSKLVAPYNDYITLNSSQSSYWYTHYYFPRWNQTELEIDDYENLESIDLHLEGSSQLAGYFFKTMHYGTIASYCTSGTSGTSTDSGCSSDDFYSQTTSTTSTTSTTGNKYNLDKKAHDINSDLGTQKITWNKNKNENETIFNFLTIVQYPEKSENKWSTSTSTSTSINQKYKYVFSTSSTSSTLNKSQLSSSSSKVPQVSSVGVWYSLTAKAEKAEKDKKKLTLTTKVRPISIISGVADWKGSTSENKTSDKLVGSMARAGFQIWKAELSYKKKST